MQIDKEFVLQELRKQGKNEHVQKAIQELHAHGFNWFLYPGIERFLRSFDPAQFPAAAAVVETTPSGQLGQSAKAGG